MPVLILKNQEMESTLDAIDLSPITDGLIHGESKIEGGDIDYINRARTYFYASNNLVAQIENPARSSEEFYGSEIRVNGFWKDKDSAASEFEKYRRFNTKAKIVVSSKDKVVVQIDPTDKEEVENYFRTVGIKKPDFGFLIVVFRFASKVKTESLAIDPLGLLQSAIEQLASAQTVERAFILKYTHNPLFSNVTQFQPPRNIAPSKNIYRTAAHTAETIFIPKLESEFVYNYYEKSESDYAESARKNFQGQKLSDIPKYIRLTWTRPSFDLRAFAEATKADPVVDRAWNPPTNPLAPGGQLPPDPNSPQKMREVSERLMEPGRIKPTKSEAEREGQKDLAKSAQGNTNRGVAKDWMSGGDD